MKSRSHPIPASNGRTEAVRSEAMVNVPDDGVLCLVRIPNYDDFEDFELAYRKRGAWVLQRDDKLCVRPRLWVPVETALPDPAQARERE